MTRWRRRCLAAALCLIGVPTLAQSPGPFAAFELASEPILNDPHDLALGPDGHIYVADKFGHRIVVLDAGDLSLVRVFAEAELPGVHDVSFGPDGRLYVAVTGANMLAIYDVTTDPPQLSQAFGGFARTEGALAHSNGTIYVMASGTGQLLAIRDGSLVAGMAGFVGAHDVAEAPNGDVWVADNARARLVRLTAGLEIVQVLEDAKFGFIGPRYLDVDSFGRLVVADQDAHRVLLIDPDTETVLGIIGDGVPGMGPGKFDDPEGALIVGSSYYFADSDNNRIVKYTVVVN